MGGGNKLHKRTLTEGFLRIGCWGVYLGLRRTTQQGSGEDYKTRTFMLCTAHEIFSGDKIKTTETSRECNAYGKMCIQSFGRETWRKRTTWKTGVDGKIILKWIFETWDGGQRTGWICLRTGKKGGFLCMRRWALGFHKMQGIAWLAEDLLASQEDLCCVE